MIRPCLLSLLISVSAALAERPNIIIILADDMGFSDIGAYGGEIATPTLDALAAEGVRFTRFYNTARCCPTRASLLTGRHPHETGIGWMTSPSHAPDRLDHGPDFPAYRGALDRRSLTLAEALKPAGYATFMTGKWHLGMKDRTQWPLQRGFDRYYGCLDGATNFFFPEHPRGITLDNTPLTELKSTTERRYYTTDAFTDYAIRFLDEERRADNRPFFLYLAYTAPHWPLHAHEEEVARYVGTYLGGWDRLREARLRRQRELGLFDQKVELTERSHVPWDSLTGEKQREMDLRMAYYAAMIDRMDQNIGRLVAYLKRAGTYENTLILFLSDNGACHEGGRLGGPTDPFDRETWERTYGPGPSYGEAWANASNTPYRKFKHYTHEGGIATPLVAHWPRGIPAGGGWYRTPACLIDIMPTLLELAGTTYPETRDGRALPPLDGVSLTPAFAGLPLNRSQPLFWEHEDHAAVLDGPWKLVGSDVALPQGLRREGWELYNLENDPTEQRDLAAAFPEAVHRLSQAWLDWAYRAGVYPKPKTRTRTEP